MFLDFLNNYARGHPSAPQLSMRGDTPRHPIRERARENRRFALMSSL